MRLGFWELKNVRFVQDDTNAENADDHRRDKQKETEKLRCTVHMHASLLTPLSQKVWSVRVTLANKSTKSTNLTS